MAELPHIIKISDRETLREAVATAAGILRSGGLVVLPTETVYGVAAAPHVPGAMQKLYRAKGRKPDKPIALFAPNVAAVEKEGAVLTPGARMLAERFWPGPLTLVLPTGKENVGFRIPDHPVPHFVLEEMNVALAVTSANRSGHPPARTAEDAVRELGDAVELVLDGGTATGGVPSTVVRIADSKVDILRKGAILEREIENVLAELS